MDCMRIEENDELNDQALPTNVQRNEVEGDDNDIVMFNAERTLNQMNSHFVCGFKTPESHVHDLLNPAHAKYFTVLKDQSNQSDQKDIQMRKTKILYGLFLTKKKAGLIKTKSFQEFITDFLQGESDDRGAKSGMQSSFGFVMNVLREMKSMGNLLEKSLENVVESLKRCEPGEFYANDKLSFSMDISFNDARAFMIELIQTGSARVACLAYKTLFLIGMARSNVEDLLTICQLLGSEKRVEIDLRDEIEILKKVYDKETMAASKQEDFNPGELQKIT